MGVNFLNYFEQSIKRLVMASFVFVLLLPITFFIYSLFQTSWQQVEQRMLEKHHLISSALVEPFTLFITNKQHSLKTIGEDLLHSILEHPPSVGNLSHEQHIQHILDKHLNLFGEFSALSYSSDLQAQAECISTIRPNPPLVDRAHYTHLPLIALPISYGIQQTEDGLSPVFKSAVNHEPVVLIKHSVFNLQHQKQGTLYAEISLTQIQHICKNIVFGSGGHCVVVDSHGHVIAHPNAQWVKDTHDLSELSIVKKMLNGQSGVAEFYSPYLEKQMVAGFSAIPTLGWGIMIPQPKSEITSILDQARFNTLLWLLAGVLIALLVAGVLTRKITQPINLLILRTNQNDHNYDTVALGNAPKNSPIEIRQLWHSFSRLLCGLQHSNLEVKRLNSSLQEDIQQATAELREANQHLYKTSTQDYLTSLANRRHFTSYLTDVLHSRVGENIGVIILDIDFFKDINDNYGHEVGDLALKHVSDHLKNIVRPCDLVARLGGDEFIIYIQNPSDQALTDLAQTICRGMEHSPLIINTEALPLTLSVGTANQHNDGSLSIKTLLRYADRAMYRSKTSGRNCVSSYLFQEEAS